MFTDTRLGLALNPQSGFLVSVAGFAHNVAAR
jgi:hypothetical protein